MFAAQRAASEACGSAEAAWIEVRDAAAEATRRHDELLARLSALPASVPPAEAATLRQQLQHAERVEKYAK